MFLRLSIISFLTLAAVVVWWPLLLAATSGAASNEYLQVHFLDVGQGDAIFIETPDGVQVLIDGGPDGTVVRQLSAVMPLLDRTIDLVIGTHPDKDHIGGLIDVLERYQVDHILVTGNQGITAVAKRFQDSVVAEGAVVHAAQAGQWYRLGEEVLLLVYSPAGRADVMESNASSIVAQVVFGEISFLLTGDATIAIEDYLASTFGTRLDSDVLKLGHHGSRTSSSELFLDTVTPQYTVVQAGSDNSYGHPHPEVVERVTTRSIPMLHTGEVGRVTIVSDGQTVWLQE